jgi:hypothetical protein
MVEVPTSKLRLAEASCSATAAFCAHEGQRVLRRQHVEVGLAHAQDEVLPGAFQHEPRLLHLALRLPPGDPVGGPVQRLRGTDRRVLRRVVAVHGRGRVLEVGAGDARGQAGRGQDAGARLLGAVQARVVLGLGRLPAGVVRARGFVQLQQAFRAHRGGEQQCQGCREGKKPHPIHRPSLWVLFVRQ